MKTSIYILLLSIGFGANSWGQANGNVPNWAQGTGNMNDNLHAGSVPQGHDQVTPVSSLTPLGTTYSSVPTAASLPTHVGPGPTAKESQAHQDDLLKELEDSSEQPDKNSKDSKKTAGGGGCGDGKFGGASCDTTDAINMGVSQANKFIQSVGSAAVSNKSASVQNSLSAQGASATNSEYLKGQAETADAAKKANNLAGAAQMMNAGVQTWRAVAHKMSVSTIKEKADAEEISQCGKLETKAEVDACTAPIRTARDAEMEKQKSKAMESAALALMTTEQGAASLEQANIAGNMADSLRQTAGNMGQGTVQFQLNAPTGGILDEGLAITAGTAPDAGGVVGDGAAPGLDGGLKDFNPNANNNGVLGPQAAAFNDAKGAEGGAGSGQGLGGAGGTSASKDTGDGKQEAAAGKSQTGGQFAAGEGGSAKFGRNGGSGSGVGFDTNFGDLLKKLLPGDDKKDAHASLDLNSDRSPASDQAAVMGRNKNIFFEISKRYQKKNNEGSVIFQ